MAVAEPSVAERDTDLVNKLRTIFGVAKQYRRSYYDNWRRNYRLVHNRVGVAGRESWAPAPRDSEIYPNLSALVAWMTDQHTNVDVSAASDPNDDYYTLMSAIASDLGTVLQTNWVVEDEASQIKMAVWDALQYGAGFFKAIWDQSLAGGLGNAKSIRVDPWCLYIDPTATSLHDAEYLCEVHRMSLDEIERRWPGSRELVEASSSLLGEGNDERPTQFDEVSRVPKANPGSFGSGNGGNSTRWGLPNGRNGMGAPPVLPGVVVYEFWIKENDEYWASELPELNKGLTLAPGEKPPDHDEKNDEKKVAVRWRVVVMAANQILLDEWADELTTYASHPYDRFVFEETGEMFGIALVDHLAHPQMALNRILTAIQSNAELIGNPVFIEAENSGLARVNIINRPGQRLRLSGTAAMQNKPEWLQPPEMPAYVQQLVDFWIGRIENTSGLSAAVKGGQDSRTPEGVVSTVQEAAFVRIRSALANLESALTSQAYKLADLIIDNYTDPRVVAITGPEGEKSALALSARHFTVPTHKGATPLKYSLLIQAGASMPTSRQARVAEADTAYALGIIDRQAWMEAHAYPNWQKVLERVNKQIAAGMFNPPGQRQRSRK